MWPRRAVWLLLPVLADDAATQPAGEPWLAGTPPVPVFVAPIYEGGVRKNRGLSIPMNLRPGPEARFASGYTASNSYLNPGYLVCRDSSCRLDYQTDHTGNLLYANLAVPLAARWEFGLGIGLYRLGDIPHWAVPQGLAGDRALRRFHEAILDEESLPTLSGARDGGQVFSLSDFAGRSLELAVDEDYLLPLRIDFTRYFTLKRTGRVLMSLNTGFHLAQPLAGDPGGGSGETAFSRGLDLGFSVNFVRSRRLTANLSSTFHLQLARIRSDVHVVNEASPVSWDDAHRSQYALSFGLRFADTFSGTAPCSVALSQVSSSAAYDKEAYWTGDPLVFAGGNNLRGALAGANDFGVFSFACEYRARQLQLSLVEDIGGLSQLIDDDGAGTSYDPDFAVSVSVSWRLGRERAVGD